MIWLREGANDYSATRILACTMRLRSPTRHRSGLKRRGFLLLVTRLSDNCYHCVHHQERDELIAASLDISRLSRYQDEGNDGKRRSDSDVIIGPVD
jgi:hypothetical protein